MPGTPKTSFTRLVRSLALPKASSHKGDNGRLLVIGGSEKYHGAPLLAIQAAAHYCDLVYYSSIPENLRALCGMKSHSPLFISVPEKNLPVLLKNRRFDCVALGMGMEKSARTKKLARLVLKSGVRCVLDAGALASIKPSDLHSNCIVTPHAGEFEKLFGQVTSANYRLLPKQLASRYHTNILLKFPAGDVITDGKRMLVNTLHNPGQTKGGTGDVLAGLTGALFATNPDPVKCAASASFLEGLAAQRLKKKMGLRYTAEELTNEIPLAEKSIRN